MKKQHVVIIGGGLAAIRLMEQLRERSARVHISIFSKEKTLPYNRIQLSSYLNGEITEDDLTTYTNKWFRRNNVSFHPGETVQNVLKEEKKIITASGEHSYDHLVFATGSLPLIPPVEGVEKEGVFPFRTLEDCRRLVGAAEHKRRILVIGGGLLGLEAANGLSRFDAEVTVIQRADNIMDRQLDRQSAAMLQGKLERRGVKFLLSKDVTSVLGLRKVSGIAFGDGTHMEADMVVFAIGIRPQLKLAEASGIETNRGIIVNDRMETSEKHIYAIGECIEHDGRTYGLVQPVNEQADVLARRLSGEHKAYYKGSSTSAKLKISGVELFSVGSLIEDEATKSWVLHDEENELYKKIVFRHKTVQGAVLYGNTTNSDLLKSLVMTDKPINASEKKQLLSASSEPAGFLLEMPGSDTVCACNNVNKNTIIQAVQEKELTTLDEVKTCTGASTSCGGCSSMAEGLLKLACEGKVEAENKTEALCGCTGLDHPTLINRLMEVKPSTPEEAMDALNWKTPEGCEMCRPAIAYYLYMIQMKQGELSSNETLPFTYSPYISLETDGTYTLQPIMKAGIISPDLIKNLNTVIEKYQLSYFHITAGGRIQLPYVEDEDVVEVCDNLDIPLLNFPGFQMTAVQSVFKDRIRERHNPGMVPYALELEEPVEAVPFPDTLRFVMLEGFSILEGNHVDAGLLKMEDKWEFHIHFEEKSVLLFSAPTFMEIKEYIWALLQYYRETAFFKESFAGWCGRMTIIHIREGLFDPETREQLLHQLSVCLKKPLPYHFSIPEGSTIHE